jgi:hypothetical protein
MTTTTTTGPAWTYRAQTDAATKTWHLGAAEKDNVCFCGARLLVADDPRKVAARIPAGQRQYETSEDLTRVTCGGCRRHREWERATAAAPAPAAREARRPAGKRRGAATRAAARTAGEAGQ